MSSRMGKAQRPEDLQAFRFQIGSGEFVILSYATSLSRRVRELTPAEHDVLRHVLAGATNARIAAVRRTSKNTVANQVASIFRKTGVCSRAELAAFVATERGGRSWDR